jgi:hypothetical protein
LYLALGIVSFMHLPALAYAMFLETPATFLLITLPTVIDFFFPPLQLKMDAVERFVEHEAPVFRRKPQDVGRGCHLYHVAVCRPVSRQRLPT